MHVWPILESPHFLTGNKENNNILCRMRLSLARTSNGLIPNVVNGPFRLP
jgi:hypothetical protein